MSHSFLKRKSISTEENTIDCANELMIKPKIQKTTVDNDRIVDVHTQHFLTHGYVIVRNVWDQAQVAQFIKHAQTTVQECLFHTSDNKSFPSPILRGKGRMDVPVTTRWPVCKKKSIRFPKPVVPILRKLVRKKNISFVFSFYVFLGVTRRLL